MAEYLDARDGGLDIPPASSGMNRPVGPAPAASGSATANAPGPLDMPAGRDVIFFLEREGVLRPADRAAAMAMLRPPGAWLTFLRRLLLGLGAGFLLAGAVLFFAY